MEFGILGPLQVRLAGVPVLVSGARERRLLALLLLSPDRVAPLEYLVDAIWEDDPPATARRQVQNAMSALRHDLRPDSGAEAMIVTEGPGYRIRVDEDRLDALRFDRLVERAQALPAGHDAEAADLLGSALGLWRGPALAGLSGRVIQRNVPRARPERWGTARRRPGSGGWNYGAAGLVCLVPRPLPRVRRAGSGSNR